MTEQKHGAPVRVERSDPDLVAAVAKAKALDPDEVKVVGRLEGLLINEESLHRVAIAASEALTSARRYYERSMEDYINAVHEREEEEVRVNQAEGNADG